ncbi:ABC transporter permease [Gulosibacter chungangensis]|uniref:ABC transporter permease n=1 Tax=Gulosibacter chungangensis TaxID=979746 RepID=A0A7J5BA34_9MICO|nr:ABC transporter permease [Gulosibacter chungangensis]KAB1642706.1 ABC transporter permease [Gulosibacter chungangensis]
MTSRGTSTEPTATNSRLESSTAVSPQDPAPTTGVLLTAPQPRLLKFGAAFAKIWTSYGIFLILGVLVVGLAIATPTFLTTNNLLNVGGQIAVMGFISLGVLLTVITGNVDLTVGAMVGLAGAIMAMIGLGMPAPVALAGGLVLGFAVGIINGYLSTRGKNLSVIVTLAGMSIIQGVTLLITNGQPVYGFDNALNWLGFGTVFNIPVSLIALVLTSIILSLFLQRTRWGREFYAVGGNAEAARLAGIPINRRVMLAFVLSAILAVIGGLVLLGRVASAQPSAGVGMELNAVGAVLIGGASLNGGAGKVMNTLAGVLILGLITNGINLLNINGFVAYVVIGVVILFAILMNQWERKGGIR